MSAVLGALAVLAVAGCGGGVTRAGWARDADAICAEYERPDARPGSTLVR